MATERNPQILASTYKFLFAVRKSNWFGDFYFAVEEITGVR